MARLSAAARKALPASAFAGPNRSYPIPDASHARNALARVSQFGSSAEKKRVRAAVGKRYGGISQAADNAANKRMKKRMKG